MRIKSVKCRKAVSNEIPMEEKDLIIRAYILCPECLAKEDISGDEDE